MNLKLIPLLAIPALLCLSTQAEVIKYTCEPLAPGEGLIESFPAMIDIDLINGSLTSITYQNKKLSGFKIRPDIAKTLNEQDRLFHDEWNKQLVSDGLQPRKSKIVPIIALFKHGTDDDSYTVNVWGRRDNSDERNAADEISVLHDQNGQDNISCKKTGSAFEIRNENSRKEANKALLN